MIGYWRAGNQNTTALFAVAPAENTAQHSRGRTSVLDPYSQFLHPFAGFYAYHPKGQALCATFCTVQLSLTTWNTAPTLSTVSRVARELWHRDTTGTRGQLGCHFKAWNHCRPAAKAQSGQLLAAGKPDWLRTNQ